MIQAAAAAVNLLAVMQKGTKKPFTAASHAHRLHHAFIAHRDLIVARLSLARLLLMQKLTRKLHCHARVGCPK
jgi:hypothetical protein